MYQNRRGNVAETVATLNQLAKSNDLHERLWAMHGLALSAPTEAESVAIYRRVLAMKPDFLPAIGNLPGYALDAGHEEEALPLFERAAAAYAKGADDYTRDYSDGFALDVKAAALGLEGDQAGAAATFGHAQGHGGGGPVIEASRPFATARAYAQNHDFAACRRTLAEGGLLDPAKLAAAIQLSGPQLDLAGYYAIAADDQPAIAGAYLNLIAQYARMADGGGFNERSNKTVAMDAARVVLAPALARIGRIADARSVVAPVANDYDAAIRARGLIEAYAGRPVQSDAILRRAVARTPSLPAGHLAWAEAALVTGRPQLAAEQAKLANEKGPRSAGALMLWGDALNAQKDVAEAESKYAEAALLAPAWGRLRINWANALWRLHRREDAVMQMRQASSMALSSRDRLLLQQMWQTARAKMTYETGASVARS